MILQPWNSAYKRRFSYAWAIIRSLIKNRDKCCCRRRINIYFSKILKFSPVLACFWGIPELKEILVDPLSPDKSTFSYFVATLLEPFYLLPVGCSFSFVCIRNWKLFCGTWCRSSFKDNYFWRQHMCKSLWKWIVIRRNAIRRKLKLTLLHFPS